MEELQKQRSTSLDMEEALTDEFLSRGYKLTYPDAGRFEHEIEKEFPGINKWVSAMNRGIRSIEDVIADKLQISGNYSF